MTDTPKQAREAELSCYCVCHSPNSSNAWCEHCQGINEVGAVHNPRLKALIAQERAAAAIEELEKARLKCLSTDKGFKWITERLDQLHAVIEGMRPQEATQDE